MLFVSTPRTLHLCSPCCSPFLCQVSDEKKFQKTDAEEMFDKFFSDDIKAKKMLERVSFEPFADTAEAVVAMTACMEAKVAPSLKKFLKKKLKQHSDHVLVVADKNIAVSLKESIKNLQIVHNDKTQELFRGIRCYMDELLCSEDSISHEDLRSMQLGLSHSIGRYKLKFSADKVDTMVIQAVGLLDELDKEINTYAMRVKEWYGWHFPELQALTSDNIHYAKLVLKCGLRPNFKNTDLSSIIEDEAQQAIIKEAAEISMGTEVADLDMIHVQSLAEQVLSMTEYRSQLFDYLKNRMNAIAPNLTILVGELVGARLISHAGSLMNLAKQPASTVQILGAEKALFRALKTKHDTPKYGLIYHASLIGQATPKHKGKISRMLAAKCALAIRVDALSDDVVGESLDTTIGFEGRAKVEARLRQLEGGVATNLGGGGFTAKKTARYDPVAAKMAAVAPAYNNASDMALDTTPTNGGHTKEEEEDSDEEAKTPKEKKKKAKKEKKSSEKKKSKKRKADDEEDEEGENGGAADSKEDDDDDDAAAKKAKKEAKKAKKEKRKSKE
jgi:nucleolar protein 58